MKYPIFPLFIYVLILLSGCGRENGDFKAVIIEVKDESILVVEHDPEPDTSYPQLEILVNDETKVDGKVDSLADLKVDQVVEIYFEGDKKVNNGVLAERITVVE